MKYYCTQCGAQNVRPKTKSNYGCVMSALDLLLFVGSIATLVVGLWPLSVILFLGCIVIACSVRKTRICRHCKNENCLIPMNSPQAKAATGRS